ncbi:LuxR family transcriptional regulator [Streptomyces sp. NBC_00154]|uniref:helix-turn-helix transcriptional regulator n=1 Tax=Streptomyces sp. NBC_00154 TaxID=2975670 RepID=UPI00225AAD93|nr:LuxR family transcriptional regulator [Streptomyces sp. NBC_00154]MCX5311166.1 AAA family ATPase [Streptomyces sp. NBC_00154]
MSRDRHANDSGPGKLVGRRQDLERLDELLDPTADVPGALLLSGEPGVGKTALLNAVAQRASAAGARVLRAAGAEFEADMTYSGLNQILFLLHEEIEALDDVYREALRVALGFTTGRAPEGLVVANATLALLRRAASSQPLLLIVDDLPWIDRASAVVLGFVARRLTGSRITVLAAARRGHHSFFDGGSLPEHEVLPLDDESARQLVGTRHPGLVGGVMDRIITAAHGNPLALLELPTALTGPQRAALERLPDVLPLSRRLEALYVSRVADLPAASRRLLLVAALDGTGDLAVLQLAGHHPLVAATLVDFGPAEHDDLVRIDESDHRLHFRHPLIRSAIVEASTTAERRASHRVLAEVLKDQLERRAWHLGEASVEPDEEVAALLERSAHRVIARGDSVAAIRALTRAGHLSPEAPDRARRLARAAFIGADATGELVSASHLLEGARQAGSEDHASLYSAATAVHLILNSTGDIDLAHHVIVSALEEAMRREGAYDPAMDEALYVLLLVCHFSGRGELWEAFNALMKELPEVPPVMTVTAATLGDPARADAAALRGLDDMLTGLALETDPTKIVRVSTACVYVDRLPSARDASWGILRHGRAAGLPIKQLGVLPVLCQDAFNTGRWDEVITLADEGLDLREQVNYPMYTWYFRYEKALVAAVRGDIGSATETADAMTSWAVSRGAGLALNGAEHLRVLSGITEGDFESAYRHAAAISPAGTLARYVPHAMWVVMDLVEAAVRTDRLAAATAHVRAAQEAGIADISPRLALLVGGAAALAAPADDKAIALYHQALSLPGIELWPFERARVTLAHGERLRKAKMTSAARKALVTALETFEELEARPWADRARRELKAAGWTFGRGPGTTRLTPQEWEIAHLAASGLTNKQIAYKLQLSHRTVSGHLYQAFPKLGITSRAALRDALANLDQR